MDYQKQGSDFLLTTGTKMSVVFVGTDLYFDDDKEPRDIYRITFERNGKKYTFRFGQSIKHSSTGVNKELAEIDRIGGSPWGRHAMEARKQKRAPSAYDVLSCLTKYAPGTIDDFADEYGYRDAKPSKLQRIYASVVEEWEGVQSIFGDVLENLREIA